MALEIGDHNDLSAAFLHHLFPDNPFSRPVAPLHENMRPELLEKPQGVGLVEKHDVVDHLQRREELGPIRLGKHRAAGSFDFPDRAVAIERDDQNVAELLCFAEKLEVAAMDDIEAAVREDHPLARSFGPRHDALELLELFDLFAHVSIGNMSSRRIQSGRSFPGFSVTLRSPVAMAQKVRESLKASFKEGVFASVMFGVTDHYVIPFALYLGATAQQVGWVSGLPSLLASLSQLCATRAVDLVGGRLRLVIRAVSVQAALLLLIALLALGDFRYRVEAFLFLLVLFAMSGALAGPAWGSLMTEYIPKAKRGAYFGWRNRVLGLVHVLSMIVAGLVLYGAGALASVLGFFLIFLVGAFSRFVSAAYLAKMNDVARRRDPASDFTFLMFVARFRESNFVKFVAFAATQTFAAHLAAPFFAVFMLRDLQFSYLTYMTLQVLSTVTGLLTLPLWGRHADLVGNAKILRLTGLMVSLVPLLWLISDNVFYLAPVQAFAGFAWSGTMLCASNFIYDAVTPQKRVRCISYFNVINGVAIFAGASVGGFLASRLPPLWGYSLLGLFAVSFAARLFFYLLFARRFREVRASKEVSIQELIFSVVGVRPLVASREP